MPQHPRQHTIPQRTLLAGARGRAHERSRGSVTAELAIATPLLLLLLMLIVQFGLIYSAQQAAQTAAAVAVNAARAQGASPSIGQVQGEQTLRQLASSELPDGQITVSLSGTQASVTVTGHPESVIPGWHPQITVHASAPLETYEP